MLFDSIIYGPIHSRRLGVSLGVNLMPTDAKLCTFNCVYCECGWNKPVHTPKLPTAAEVALAMEEKLQQMQARGIVPDVITFSGNGEPTLHPQFEQIIDDTCRLRDRYCPAAKVSVLSNSTQLMRDDVVRALWKVDNRILKLDSAIDETMRKIDLPVNKNLTVHEIMERLKVFNGDFILQTCFLRTKDKGQRIKDAERRIQNTGQLPNLQTSQPLTLEIDNTTSEELDAWYKAVEELQPKQIMIYVIDRKTPAENLEKIEPETMHAIADTLRKKGFEVSVSC